MAPTRTRTFQFGPELECVSGVELEGEGEGREGEVCGGAEFDFSSAKSKSLTVQLPSSNFTLLTSSLFYITTWHSHVGHLHAPHHAKSHLDRYPLHTIRYQEWPSRSLYCRSKRPFAGAENSRKPWRDTLTHS